MQWSDRIGRRLKTRDLHVFLAVTERGNMAKAAEQLAISRPVVSKAIADLEHTLGVRLLDRTPQGVEPTIYGKALLRRSLSVFEELRQSVKEIEFLADPATGDLRVGFGEVTAAGLVPAAIARLTRSHPRMTIHTEQGTIGTVLDFLRSRRCEVAVGRISPDAPDLAYEPIHYEQLRVVVGARSKWARARRLRLADLTQEAWILAPVETEPGSPTFAAFQSAGLPAPTATVTSASLNLRFGLLQSGHFVTVIPDSALAYGSARTPIKVLPIALPKWHVPTCATSPYAQPTVLGPVDFR